MGAAVIVPGPAAAFSIFGFHLWGEEENPDRVDVIDPLDYTATLTVTGDTDLEGTVEKASALYANREQPASGRAGLLSRAKADYRRILGALYEAGYYGPSISILVAGHEAADLSLAVDLPAKVPVAIAVDTGPKFDFGQLTVVNPPPPMDTRRQRLTTPASLGFQPGETAEAGAIGKTSDLAIAHWRMRGHAKAAETGREVVADHPASQLDVALTFDPGREARYGPTSVVGATRTDPEFIRFMTDLDEGDRFDSTEIARSQARLGRLGIFRSMRIEEADEIAPDGTLPMTVRVQDRKPRSLGFGGTYSTIDGLGLEAYWMHRNLWGHGERLRFDASIEGLLEQLDPADYDYNVGVTFTKPGVYSPDTDFVTGLAAKQLDYDTYRETSLSGNIGFSQQFGDRLTGDLSAFFSKARFEDIYGTRNFFTLGALGNLTYDIRNDPLDATRGYFIQASLQPFYEFEYGNPAVRGTLEGRYYYSLVGLDTLVLAGRVKVGSYYGPGAAESPPDLLFFAGGGGSVRGYAYRSIGVTTTVDGEEGTIGGRGLFEGSGEARYRISESFGAVAFTDVGFVTADPRFSGEHDTKIGVGAGFRYFSPIGPLRVDLATPLEPEAGDSRIALYIGIGQAF
ncbi:outer membrane protein assembly factor [Amaricoccus solimangrovi]|uniref:Outer membrane protein assembly factor n=2 Tax=Amaricoccus solimangrovi TaxID=2589815 RepID=A0A501WVV5_9RHOB|nr:outer membrane protein assembly factor [Amaricoccus solimangrovi]